ncbi:MAG TPA: hypothetical protein VIU11_14120, partial [Nakamurella sp.]
IRDVLRPDKDRVRIAGDDDPSGGVLEGMPDRFTLASLPALWRRRARAGGEAEPQPEPEPDPEPMSEHAGTDLGRHP